MNKSALIIGKPHSGKTTFLAQLYGRLDSGTSSIILSKPVENLEPIIDALKNLAAGNEVRPTPSDKNLKISLSLKYDNHEIELSCPDYGGEQINQIIETREINDNWTAALRESDSWILFIRCSNLTTEFDLSNKTIKPETLNAKDAPADEYTISDQSSYIELLQIMLSKKGQDSHFKNSSTKLTIVLTCWDELGNEELPIEKLIKFLPLLLEYIQSNWNGDKIKVLGLSSLGFNLAATGNKEKYLADGAEKYGFLVLPGGQQINDISELILEAI